MRKATLGPSTVPLGLLTSRERNDFVNNAKVVREWQLKQEQEAAAAKAAHRQEAANAAAREAKVCRQTVADMITETLQAIVDDREKNGWPHSSDFSVQKWLKTAQTMPFRENRKAPFVDTVYWVLREKAYPNAEIIMLEDGRVFTKERKWRRTIFTPWIPGEDYEQDVILMRLLLQSESYNIASSIYRGYRTKEILPAALTARLPQIV